MHRSTILALSFLALGALVPAACTANFSVFEPSGGAGGSTSSSSGTGASTSSTGGGGTGGCMADADCDDVNPCTTDTCVTTTGKCKNVNVPDGPLAGMMPGTMNCQTPGCVAGVQAMVPDDTNVPPSTSCATFGCSMGTLSTNNLPVTTMCGQAPEHCDGNGNCVGCMTDGDCPDVTDCQTKHCDVPTMTCTPSNNGLDSGCNSGGGKFCDGNGTCVPCTKDSECGAAPQICVSNGCMPSCADGMKDGVETDKDCGGACSTKCGTGKGCNSGFDCQSKVCQGGTCQGPSCNDQVQNGTETDKDCGGSTCDGMGKTCADGKKCGGNGDCTNGHCINNVCVNPCFDGVMDGTETDKDCGGSCTAKCATSKMCQTGTDCQSGFCVGNVCVDTCHNGVKDANETGVDCGGACAAGCADGTACMDNNDCTNGYCNGSNKCATPTCTDTFQNGNETDTDCGGAGFMGATACPKCVDGKACGTNADCANNTCIGNLCYPASCGNGAKDAPETDIDCGGGTCPKCANMKTCAMNSDCVSNNCNAGSMKCM